MTNNHLGPEQVVAYINFSLDDEEERRIISHLGECDMCLSQVEAQWENHSRSVPDLPDKTIESRLLQSIHRSNLAGSLVRLGVRGFLGAMLGLVAPLITPISKIPARKKK